VEREAGGSNECTQYGKAGAKTTGSFGVIGAAARRCRLAGDWCRRSPVRLQVAWPRATGVGCGNLATWEGAVRVPSRCLSGGPGRCTSGAALAAPAAGAWRAHGADDEHRQASWLADVLAAGVVNGRLMPSVGLRVAQACRTSEAAGQCPAGRCYDSEVELG